MSLLSCLAFVACSDKEDAPTDQGKELTEEEIKAACEKTWNEVSDIMGDKYLEAKSPSDLQECANGIQKLDYVDKAFIDNDGMHVILKNGTLWSWTFFHLIPEPDEELLEIDKMNTPSGPIPVLSKSSSESHISKKSDNQKVKVLIFNQTFRDESRTWTKKTLKDLKKYLEDRGFEVTLEEGNYGMKDLDEYDLVLLHTHGLYKNGKHYLLTSVKLWTPTDDTQSIKETRNGKVDTFSYLAITETQILRYYSGKKLNNKETLIFATSCQSLMGDKSLAFAFSQCGASGFIGYTDSNNVGVEAADSFFKALAEDATIEEAINLIPNNYKNQYQYVDDETGEITKLNAHLEVYYSSQDNKNNCYAHLCPKGEHPHLIDMGNGLKWSCCNIGATSPSDIGNYYSWGETKTKSSYSYFDNYEMQSGTYFPSNISQSDNDAAWVNSNHVLRMPTKSEFQTLLANSTFTWGKYQGTDGGFFTSTVNGNKIFVPAGGWIFDGENMGRGETGILWTANRDPGSPFSWFMQATFNIGNPKAEIASSRFSGHNVRGVTIASE